jgi:hypothetical protein
MIIVGRARWRARMARRCWRPRRAGRRCLRCLVREGWNGFNVLHTAASRVGGARSRLRAGAGGKDVAGILRGRQKGEIECVYLLGADEIDMPRFRRRPS